MDSSEVEKIHSERWGRLGFEKLESIEKEFLGLYWLGGDVNNGGFEQYFFNSSGDMAKEALAGLKRTGDVRISGILERAMNAIPGGWVADRINRQNRSEVYWEDEDSDYNKILSACDEEFYSLNQDPMVLLMPLLTKFYEERGITLSSLQ